MYAGVIDYVPDILPKAKSKNFIARHPFNKTTNARLKSFHHSCSLISDIVDSSKWSAI